jgi:nitroimidazol reductase NimA-like FMN-containing flavoprotein (pyridoxamine 5'-phosphate oxidase superfamily)
MNNDLRNLAVRLLDEHRIMTIAMNRRDGWPQATVVGYANDGLTIYCFVSRLSQKFVNIMRDNRVSIAIAGDFSDPVHATFSTPRIYPDL